MAHFHLPAPWTDSTVLAPDSLRHHLRVRRIEAHESIDVFDGYGHVAKAQIAANSSDKELFLNLEEIREDRSTEPRHRLVLAQGIAGGDKMDWLIEKAVELGVTDIVPIQAQRGVVKLDEKRAQKRLLHWQALIVAACEQSGRSVIPKLHAVQSLSDWLTSEELNENYLKVLLSPRGELGLISILKRAPNQDIQLLIGPEGGFSDLEEELAIAKGFTPALLGKRILRTETAGIVAMSAVHSLWGGF